MTLRSVFLSVMLIGGLAPAAVLSAQQAAEPPGPDTVVYTPKRGTVTFTHGKHSKASECVACHHESKPEKPAASATSREKCSTCHTTPAAEPMKTTLRRAFHDTANKTGLCFTCHVEESAKGKVAPTKCDDCHVQAAK